MDRFLFGHSIVLNWQRSIDPDSRDPILPPNEAVEKVAGDELSRVSGRAQTPPNMPIVACRETGEVEISLVHLRKSRLGFFYSLNAPMSGDDVRSAEASAPLAG